MVTPSEVTKLQMKTLFMNPYYILTIGGANFMFHSFKLYLLRVLYFQATKLYPEYILQNYLVILQ